jgi:hypothetical protein
MEAVMPTTMNRGLDERTAGGLAVLVALIAMAFANFNLDPGENGGPAEFAVTAVVVLLVAALVFGRVLPATTSPGKVAVWLLAAAVITVPVFWSGLPVVLGAGALVAGLRAGGTGGTIAAVAGGALAIACTVLLIVG